MGASEVTSETREWGGERLCDFDRGTHHILLFKIFKMN